MPEFERMLVRSGIILFKYWFSITDEEQEFRFHMRIVDPLKQWKLSPDGHADRAAAGRTTPRPRKRCWSAPTFPKRRGGWSRRSTRSARGSTDRASSEPDSLSGNPARSGGAAAARAQSRLSSPPSAAGHVCAGSVLADDPEKHATNLGLTRDWNDKCAGRVDTTCDWLDPRDYTTNQDIRWSQRFILPELHSSGLLLWSG